MVDEEYQWLIDVLKKEFPEGDIIVSEADFGMSKGIGVKNGKKERAFVVKKVARYDLNEDPDKEEKTKEIVRRFHEILDN